MFGTIMRAKIKPEKLRDFYALGKEWDTFHRKRAQGFISSELLWGKDDPRDVCLIVHFTNAESYWKNASSPEQHEFYLRMRECMEADPQWIDGTYERWDSPYARPPEPERIEAAREHAHHAEHEQHENEHHDHA